MADRVIIFGYGSLMDERSAASTMPTAVNFRRGTLTGYQRVFGLVSISGIKTKRANVETNEIAALSVVPVEGSSVHGVLFEIPTHELGAYLEREHRYKTIEVDILEWNGLDDCNTNTSRNVKAWTVVSQTDDDYRTKCGSVEEYHTRAGQYYSGSLWTRDDIFPMPKYLVSVLLAAYTLGKSGYLTHLLDDTLCANGSTVRLHCLDVLFGVHNDTMLTQSDLKELLSVSFISKDIPATTTGLHEGEDAAAAAAAAEECEGIGNQHVNNKGFSLADYLLVDFEDISLI